MIYQDVARAVNENYETFDFESWASQAVADHGPEGAGNGQKAGAVDAIGTGRAANQAYRQGPTTPAARFADRQG